MRHCLGTTPVFQTKEPTDWSAPDGPEGLAAARHAPTRINTRQRESPQPNFARNLTRSLFEIGHKRCNSNDANSMFEQATGELRATLLGNHPDQRGGRTHRQAAPVTSRCTRSEGVHCLRIGCIAYGSGAPHNAGTHHRRLCRPRTYHPQAGTHETTKPQAPTATTEHGLTGNTSQPTGQARKPHPKHDEAAAGFPATASSRSVSATQRSATDQAVMST